MNYREDSPIRSSSGTWEDMFAATSGSGSFQSRPCAVCVRGDHSASLGAEEAQVLAQARSEENHIPYCIIYDTII